MFLCFVTPVRVGVILNGLITNDNDLNSVTLLQLHLVASTATDLEVASAEDSCLMLFGGARVKCAKATAHLGCIYCSCIDELFQHTVVFIHNLHIENLLETTFSNFLHHTSRVPSKFGKYAALHCTRLFFVILSLFRGRPCWNCTFKTLETEGIRRAYNLQSRCIDVKSALDVVTKLTILWGGGENIDAAACWNMPLSPPGFPCWAKKVKPRYSKKIKQR